MGSNFDRGSNFNRWVNFQHVGGHFIITPANKCHFSTLKSDSKLLKKDPGNIY